MATARAERRLAAILAADVVGYSRLIEHDEAGTLSALKALRRQVIDPLLDEHQGRIVKLMGDGALVEFGSVVDAVACAVAIQKGVAANQCDIPTERRIVFRIGVNLGDVIHEIDGDLGDIFDIQDEITAGVVGRIGPELLAAEHARECRKPHHGLDAWECVVRAVFLCSQLSEESSRKMLPLLDRAIGLAPDYAQALAMKGWITMWRAFQGWEDMRSALALARDVVQQAIVADDKEPWAYLAQAMTAYARRDDALAVAAVSQAVAINPNSAFAQGQLGLAHANGGRGADAIPCIDYALRLSPREAFLGDFQFYYAKAYFQGANYELGLSYAREAHRLRSGHAYPLIIGTACAGLLGDQDAAIDLLGRLKSLVPDISRDAVAAADPFVRNEDRARLIEGLARAGLN